MYVSTLQTLSPRTLLRRPRWRLPDLVGERCVAYRWGRDAIWWALETFELGRGDTVLLPASCCGVVLEPFIERGIRITYYALSGTLQYTLEDIEQRLDDTTRAVYVIHYFGFPQQPCAVRAFCDRRGLALLEDCAHGLLGADEHRPLGGFGDAAIFSLRKTLPVPDGGCLRLNGRHRLPRAPVRRHERAAAVGTAKLLAYHLGRRGLLPIRALKTMWSRRRDPAAEKSWMSGPGPRHDEAMSRLSEWILGRVDLGAVTERRRAHFRYWLEHLPAHPKLHALHATLPAGVTPYSFPIVVDDAPSILAGLRRRGFDFEPTLNAPFYRIPGLTNPGERFHELEAVASRLISLPVHQAVTAGSLEKIRGALSQTLCA